MAMTIEELTQMLQAMSPAQQQALLQQNYANIGTPTLNSDDRFGANGQGSGMYSAGGLDFLTRTPTGFSGPIGTPFDQPGSGGVFGQYQGQFSPTGELQGASFEQQQRPSFLDRNGYLAPLLPIAIAGGVGAFGGLGETVGAAGTGASGAAGGGAAAGTGSVLGSGITASGGVGAGGLAPGAGAGATLGGGSALTGGGLTTAGTAATLGGGSTLAGGGLAAGAGTGGITAGGGLGAGGLTAGANAAGTLGGGTALGAGAGAGAGASLLDSIGGVRGAAALAGAGLGAAGSGSTTATQSTTVPEELRQFSTDLAERGQRFADQPFQPFTGQRFAGPNDALRNAWEMVNQASRSPNTQQTQAADAFGRLLQGNTPDLGNAERAGNQYIGATTPGTSNPYIGQNTNSDTLSLARSLNNPYLGATTPTVGQQAQMSLPTSTTSVGTNALLGLNNPALQARIDQTANDITRNFNNVVNPQFDRMARASGSFGNTGVEQMRGEAQRNLAQEIGRAATDARMADYSLQAQLGESDLARRVNTSLADAQRNQAGMQAAQQFNIGTEFNRQAQNSQFAANDLARNLAGANQQGAMMLNAGQFDVGQRAADLGRNAQLTQNLGQFNANLGQTDLGRNAQLAQNLGQFNAQQGNFDISNAANMYNAAQNRAAGTLGQWQGFAEQPFRNANALGAVGSQMNQFAQQPLDFNFQQYQAQQQDPYNRLGLYGNLYGAARGGQQQTSTTGGGNTAAGLLGGAVTGLGLYNLFNQQQTNQQAPRY